MNQRKEDTALGVARARFVDSLPQKAEEIQAVVRTLRGAPDDEASREEVRKRFHALYASAQVFRIQALAEALKRCLVVIDEARDEGRALTEADFDTLDGVLGSVSELATGQRPSIIPNMDDAVENSRYSVPRPSALGMAPYRPDTEAKTVPPLRSASSPGFPVARPPRPASNPGFAPPKPTTPPRPASSPGFSPPKPALPPRPASSPGFLPPKPARPASNPGFAPPRPESSPFGGGALGKAKSAAFAPRAGGSIPPTRPEKRISASRGAVTSIDVDRVILVLMVGGEPIAQRITPIFPKSRVELLQSANEKEAVELARESLPDVVVVAPSFARPAAEAFAEAALDHLPRVQLSPPSADEADYRLEGVTAVVAVNAPPTKLAGAIVDAACGASTRRVEARPARREGRLDGVEAVVAFDEPGVTHFIATELERAGAKVHRASDGTRALMLARTLRPALLLTGESLPEIPGAEVVERVHGDPSLLSVRTILLEIDEDLRAKMRAATDDASRAAAGAGFVRDAAIDAVAARRAVVEQAVATSRGRLRGVGIPALLEALERKGADVLLELRDLAHTVELEVRGGKPVVATYTASNGDFARGDRAFDRLASFTGGRFRITAGEGEPKGPAVAAEARDRLLAELSRRSVLLELLESSLDDGARLAIDPDLAASVGLEERVIGALGESTTLGAAKETLGERALDSLLALARVGAITRLEDASGRDLVEAGLAERGAPDVDAADLADTTPGSLPAAVEPEAADDEAEPLELDAFESVAVEEDDAEPVELPPGDAFATTTESIPTLSLLPDPEPDPEPSLPLSLEPPVRDVPPLPAAPARETTAEPPAPRPTLRRPDEAPKKPAQRGGGGFRVAVLSTLVVAGLGFAAIELFDLDALFTAGSRGASAPKSAVAEERAAVAPVAEDETPAKLENPFPEIAKLYGERREGIADRSVTIPEGHGLLVIEAPSRGEPAEVYVGGTSLGKAPVAKAFPPGPHEVTLVRGSERLFRYVFVEPGVSRVLPGE